MNKHKRIPLEERIENYKISSGYKPGDFDVNELKPQTGTDSQPEQPEPEQPEPEQPEQPQTDTYSQPEQQQTESQPEQQSCTESQPESKSTISITASDDNKYYKCVLTNIRKIEVIDSKTVNILLPAGNRTNINKFNDEISSLGDELEDFSDTDKDNIGLTILTHNNIGVPEVTLDNLDGVNQINIGGKDLVTRKLNVVTSGKEVTGKLAVAVFSGVVNQNSLFSAGLFSSGITVSLTDIPDPAIIRLNKKLSSSLVKKSRESGGLIFTNYLMVAHKAVYDFIIEHIYTTNVDVPTYELASLIRISDLQSLYLLLMRYLHQKGFELTTLCDNVLVLEDGKPKCDARITAKIDVSKLSLVDRRKLDNSQLKHMTKTSSDFYTYKQIVDYQDSNKYNDLKEYDLDGNIILELRNPTVAEYFESASLWEEFLKDNVADLTLGKTEEEIIDIIINNSSTSILNMYLHFINSIKLEDGTFTKDRDSILDVLTSLNSNDKVVSKVINLIQEHIRFSTIGYAGYYSYRCSKCETDINRGNVVAVDMVNLGFQLQNLRATVTRENIKKITF